MQKIIQIYPCLLKLSRKQESVTDGHGETSIPPHNPAAGGTKSLLTDREEMSNLHRGPSTDASYHGSFGQAVSEKIFF